MDNCDWYTDEVKAAMEIVPVEWYPKARGAAKERLRLCESDGWRVDQWDDTKNKWFGQFIVYCQRRDHEAQALIEKAFREWLHERGAYVTEPWSSGSYICSLAKAVRLAEKGGF